MKKSIAILLIAITAICGAAFALDMADYGTSVTITNSAASATMGDVLITYDSASTNTIYFDVILADGITYRIGSSSVSNATYDSATDLIAVPLKAGEAWKISTTITNVNLNIEGI